MMPKHEAPLDFSLCAMTVTLYHRADLSRHVLRGVHYEYTDRLTTTQGRSHLEREFLLVIPAASLPEAWDRWIAPGDKVLLGEGPELDKWEALTPAATPSLSIITQIRKRTFQDTLTHLELK